VKLIAMNSRHLCKMESCIFVTSYESLRQFVVRLP